MRIKGKILPGKALLPEKILLPLLILAVLIILYLTYGYFIPETEEVPVKAGIIVTKNQTITVTEVSTGIVIYKGTNDHEAIRKAVGAIDEGIVLLYGGNYKVASAIDLNSGITVIGKDCTITGYRVFRISDASGVTIRGFEFSNPDENYIRHSGTKSIIEITNSSDCHIMENTFRNFGDYGLYISTLSPLHHSTRITIKDNQFLDYGYCGIMIGKQASQIFVEDNLFKDINTRKINPNSYGVALAKGSTAYSYSEYIYIRNNVVENNPMWEGIDSHGANNVYILNNTVINCKVPIAASYQTSEGTYPLPLHTIVITGNYVKGNMNSPDKQHSGIHVLGARNNAGPHMNVTISDNIIEDVNSWLVSDDGGIVLRDVDGGTIKNNTISGVGGTGINLNNANNLVLEDNKVKNIKRISGSTLGVEMIPVAKDFSVTMRNNEFDASVDYDAFSTPGYGNIYAVSVEEQDTSKFATSNGALKVTTLNEAQNATAVNNAGVTDPSISISKNGSTTTALTGSGETVYIGNTDTDALKAAVDAVESNGTITFEKGTYSVSSPIALKSDISLIGKDAIVTGYTIFTITDRNNVTIEGLEFSNPDEEYLDRAGNNGLIYIQNSSNAFIRENTLRNFRDFGIYLGTSSTSDSNRDITIEDNQFLDYGYAGVMIGKGASSVTVEDNTFRNINVNGKNPNAYGIAVMKGSSTYAYSDHIYIRNNTIENNPAGEAIDSHGANYLYVENNTITYSRTPMFIAHINDDDRYPVPLHHLTVTGNMIEGNFDTEQPAGIHILGGERASDSVIKPYMNITVSGNTLADTANWNNGEEKAILLENVDAPVVENNVFSGADGK
ncbi:MAG: hypothetical protein PWP14_2013 [Methanolobus sp.]|nr:hypothetical protein [Methanolobus sp.]